MDTLFNTKRGFGIENNVKIELKTVNDELVKIVNYIKSRPLNSRIFTKLCQEIGSEHEQLFLHTVVRWLSRRNVLTRFFELVDEVRILLCDGTHKKFILRQNVTTLCGSAKLRTWQIYLHI